MKLKPIGNKVVIEIVIERERKTTSGIIVKERKSSGFEGTVLAVGDAENSSLKAGDIVLYYPSTGTLVKDGDRKYLILEEQDLLAIKEN